MSTIEIQQSSRGIVVAVIMFGWAMLIHTLFMLVVGVSLPSKLTPLLMVLSATLIYDPILLIDLVRGSIPVAYSPSDVFALGIAPWLIAGILSVLSLKNTTDTLRSATRGVLLSILVLLYIWVGMGDFSLTALFMSLQFFGGSVISMVLAAIGVICGQILDPWIQRIHYPRK